MGVGGFTLKFERFFSGAAVEMARRFMVVGEGRGQCCADAILKMVSFLHAGFDIFRRLIYSPQR